MKTIHYLLSFILLISINSCSTVNTHNKNSIFSDRYRLIWNNNPKTTMTIAWNQYQGMPTLHYGLSQKTKNKIRPQRQVQYRDMNNTFARLIDLKPNSRYYFKICTSTICSDTMYFKTAPDNNQSFTFIAGGDSRSIPRGRIRGNVLVSKIRPLFIAHGGDYTKNGTATEWKRWLNEWQQSKSSDGRMYPLVVTHGNHENRDATMLNKLFDVPNVHVYSKLDFNFLSLYTLNTELEPTVGYYDMAIKKKDEWTIHKEWDKQTKWLTENLKKDTKKWKIASYHRPLRPHRKSKHEGRLRYLDWSPLFYTYGVKLAIESDSHLVKYTQPLKPYLFGEEGFVVDKKRGTTFIGEGSWGAPTRANDDDKSWTIDSGKFWQFKLITVKPKRLEIRTVKFGDEDKEYNPHLVKGITQEEQNSNPVDFPKNLDLWKSNIGEVLILN